MFIGFRGEQEESDCGNGGHTSMQLASKLGRSKAGSMLFSF